VGVTCRATRARAGIARYGHPSCARRVIMRTQAMMSTCRERLLVRLPRHPTVAGWFWIGYFAALGWLIFR